MSRPWTTLEVAALREMQLVGCGLQAIAMAADRSRREIDLALWCGLGKSADEGADALNCAREAVEGFGPAMARRVRSLFG